MDPVGLKPVKAGVPKDIPKRGQQQGVGESAPYGMPRTREGV